MKKLVVFLSVFLFLSVLSVKSAEMRIIQVDNLMYTPTNSASVKSFEKIIQSINKQKNVEFVIFSGNNISKPKKEYLESFIKQAKTLDAPFYVIMGSKELNRQKDFGKKEYVKVLQKKMWAYRKINAPNYVFTKNKQVFIVVDGSKDVITTSMGYYRADTIQWLNNQLKANKNKNVIILQHFPLIPPAEKEHMYTYKADEYLEMLSEHDNVKAIISGHFGVNKEINHNGIIHISTASAPCYRIIDIIDFETENPTFWSVIKE